MLYLWRAKLDKTKKNNLQRWKAVGHKMPITIFRKSVVLSDLLWKWQISAPKIRTGLWFDMGKRGWEITPIPPILCLYQREKMSHYLTQSWNQYHRLSLSEFQGGRKSWRERRKGREEQDFLREFRNPYQDFSDDYMYRILTLSTLNCHLCWWQPLYTQGSRNQK